MISTQTANGNQQLIAYLDPQQAQWLQSTLTNAKIPFRIDRNEKGFTVFTSEAARPYLNQLLGTKQEGKRVNGEQLLRLLLVIGIPATIIFLLAQTGWFDTVQGAAGIAGMFGVDFSPWRPFLFFVFGLLVWWAIFFVLGRKPHIIGTVGYIVLLAGLTYLVAQL